MISDYPKISPPASSPSRHRELWATIELLLARGADPNACRVPVPALFLAIKAGHVQGVRRLLEGGACTDIPLPPEVPELPRRGFGERNARVSKFSQSGQLVC